MRLQEYTEHTVATMKYRAEHLKHLLKSAEDRCVHLKQLAVEAERARSNAEREVRLLADGSSGAPRHGDAGRPNAPTAFALPTARNITGIIAITARTSPPSPPPPPPPLLMPPPEASPSLRRGRGAERRAPEGGQQPPQQQPATCTVPPSAERRASKMAVVDDKKTSADADAPPPIPPTPPTPPTPPVPVKTRHHGAWVREMDKWVRTQQRAVDSGKEAQSSVGARGGRRARVASPVPTSSARHNRSASRNRRSPLWTVFPHPVSVTLSERVREAVLGSREREREAVSGNTAQIGEHSSRQASPAPAQDQLPSPHQHTVRDTQHTKKGGRASRSRQASPAPSRRAAAKSRSRSRSKSRYAEHGAGAGARAGARAQAEMFIGPGAVSVGTIGGGVMRGDSKYVRRGYGEREQEHFVPAFYTLLTGDRCLTDHRTPKCSDMRDVRYEWAHA